MPTRYPEHRRSFDPDIPTSRAQELLQKLRRKAGRRRTIWNGHVAGFVGINAFLLFIDLVTGGGVWFPYVAGAMAIPFLSHYIHQRRRTILQHKLADEIARDPGFPDRMFKPFRRLHRSTTHFLMGLGSAVAISGYLFLINVMTGGSFWSIIPAASIALPVVFHGILFRSRRQSLIETLEAGGDPESVADQERWRRRVERHARRSSRRALRETGRLIDSGDSDGGTAGVRPSPGVQRQGPHPMLGEARRLEQEIAGRTGEAGSTQAVLLGGVADLVGEIERLCNLSDEFSRVIRTISASELQEDREVLLQRQQEGASEEMMAQYSAALEQVERQIAGIRELESRHELLELRIRTGVNSLRQINVDLVRMQGDATLDDISRAVHGRAEELSGYLNDLQQSYSELSRELGG